MQFVISRAKLVKHVDCAGLWLAHHIENAAKAKAYANVGRRFEARWYGMNARQDLGWYLEMKQRIAANQP